MEQLTEEVAKDVSANPQEWIRFLNTASRLYRYTFPEQLLIYAQRPGATAVASMEIWNQKMYRWIKKGSKGIALIDNTSGPKTKLRYVFDVQDTYKVKNLGRDPQLWNLNPEGEQLVADYLQEQQREACQRFFTRRQKKVCRPGYRMLSMNCKWMYQVLFWKIWTSRIRKWSSGN